MGEPTERELTGRKVFAIVASAFGVVIAVNITLAVFAVGTFPGIEVRNSYVASQTFDVDRKAQEALGWQIDPAYDRAAGELRLNFTDAADLPAEVAGLSVLVGRPTQAADDLRPDFIRKGADFVAAVDLAPGYWLLRVEAESRDGTPFRQRLRIHVRG